MTRQWQVLRDIDSARTGITVPKLAAARGVHQRTIRRDIDALAAAGFALYDEKSNGTSMWKLRARPFRGLEELGLSLMELCALYFSRALLNGLAGAPYQDDAARAFVKIERALPDGCRRFLDNLPVAIKAKLAGRTQTSDRKLRVIVGRATEALLNNRRVSMQYDSRASRRLKHYVIEPLRMSYADGGTYLTGYVPEYGELRNFAIERIRTLALLDEKFTPRPLPAEPFANSIGAFSGPAEHVEIAFDADVADYVTSRQWHRSQSLERKADGSVLMRLEVCLDVPLRSWILGFGGAARVVAPVSLARDVLEHIERARSRYLPRQTFEMLGMPSAVESARRMRLIVPQRGSSA